MYKIAACVIFGLCVSNFLWQIIRKNDDWEKALDRTFHQTIAIACFLVFVAAT